MPSERSRCLASANALAHRYAGLYDWAVHHRLTGWQAKSWPAEIDVFLAVGELALYVAYLDAWPARQRIWPWATALIGLAVSVAGNIGHIQPQPGQPVILADRLTAATSPLAAVAGLSVGLLVLKMTRQRATARVTAVRTPPALLIAPYQQAPAPAAHNAGGVHEGAGLRTALYLARTDGPADMERSLDRQLVGSNICCAGANSVTPLFWPAQRPLTRRHMSFLQKQRQQHTDPIRSYGPYLGHPMALADGLRPVRPVRDRDRCPATSSG